MPTEDVFLKQFHISQSPNKAICIPVDVATAHPVAGADGVIAVLSLLDVTTNTQSGQSLLVVLTRNATWKLVKLLQQHATEQGWPDPGDGIRTRTLVPPQSERH